ncbi:hypothetical protein FA743_19605 [Paracoccus gahaiensis]|uniref:Oxidoreductase FAD/NAD(P)-binding domain-containing protein n=1 Tax=Paracoccus gahaiensis TaxID=1706839 RepID=A0A4V5MUP0_9RHOB|nr:hypothetical protein [Paracoccus gahaiensis]TJZ88998.1 hypothetical protein FA743_19605 [Paracoccus gahaiensis]
MRFLHGAVRVGDVITAQRPQGEFTLPPGDGPLVLVSAGVGITPMLTMLHALVADQPQRLVSVIHAARNGRHRAFAAEMAEPVSRGGRLARRVHYGAPEDGDDPRTFDRTGRIKAAGLLALPTADDADYLLCGPAGFLADMRAGLEKGGVASGRIHLETFGPAG